MRKLKMTLLCSLFLITTAYAQKQFTLTSPNGRISTTINIGEKITYDITHDGQSVLSPSPISLMLSDGEVWGDNAKLSKSNKRSVNETILSPFYKKDKIQDTYNELKLTFKKQWGLEFRAYDDGIAYRFINQRKKPFNIQSEEVNYQFNDDAMATVPYVRPGKDGDYESQFMNSFENAYTTDRLSKLNKGRMMFLPLVVEVGNGKKICITESDLESYPGLYLTNANGNNSLTGKQAQYPKVTKQGGHNMLQMQVQQREHYIAKVNGPRTFPWRIAPLSTTDKDLANSDMTYKLGAASRVADISWSKPCKVAWDWGNNCNIDGVDFVSGINNATYKYYIDFAAAHGIEYVILDEGWAVNLKADLMQVVKEIDIKELVDYGAKKNVGIILWAGFHAFNRDMENICKHYADIGVKGFKVDFMDRDDQEMVDFNYRAAETCAKHKLILDLHGTYKRDHRVRKRFKVCRQKADDKQKHDLAEQNDLPPVDFLIRLKTNVYQLRGRCTDQKRYHRDKVLHHVRPVLLEQRRAQKNNVARLRVGKNLAATKVGICVLKSAGENDEHCRAEAVGHLSVQMKRLSDLHRRAPFPAQ